MTAAGTDEKTTLEISSQLSDELDRIRHVMIEMTEDESISHEDVIGALISGFVESLTQDAHGHDHHGCGKCDNTEKDASKSCGCGTGCGCH